MSDVCTSQRAWIQTLAVSHAQNELQLKPLNHCKSNVCLQNKTQDIQYMMNNDTISLQMTSIGRTFCKWQQWRWFRWLWWQTTDSWLQWSLQRTSCVKTVSTSQWITPYVTVQLSLCGLHRQTISLVPGMWDVHYSTYKLLTIHTNPQLFLSWTICTFFSLACLHRLAISNKCATFPPPMNICSIRQLASSAHAAARA